MEGTGRFELNGRSLEDYFPSRSARMVVTAPLRVAGREKDFDVIARLDGGGVSGQAGALRHGHRPGPRSRSTRSFAPRSRGRGS